MTQDIGPDESIQGTQSPADNPSIPSKRSTTWQRIALAITLLLVIWLIWQYLGGAGKAPDANSTVTSGRVTLPPAAITSESTESAVATETIDEGATVPDVIGMSRSSAIAAVRAAGYEASVTDVYGTTKPAGAVFQQNPSGGSMLNQGGTVGLLVQLRPGSAPTVTTPRLTGLSQSAAERKLRDAGLRIVLSYFPDAGDPGRVQSQWPLPGDPVAQGGEVQIQVTVKP